MKTVSESIADVGVGLSEQRRRVNELHEWLSAVEQNLSRLALDHPMHGLGENDLPGGPYQGIPRTTSPVLPGDFMLPSDPAARIASVLGKPLVFEHRQLAPEPATATVASLIDADLGHAVNEMRAALGAFMHAQCNNDVAEITRLRLQYPFLGGDESTVTPESYVPSPAVPMERERPQWEYRTLATSSNGYLELVNELGRDGWEVFATELTGHPGRLWFLKRRVK